MSLQAYQKQINDMLQGYKKPYWHPLSQLARLIEEVGEVARILNHQYGDKPKKPGEVHDKLEDELADILYGVFCLANSQGIALDEPMQRAIAKLETRDKDRFEKV
ncbi:MAG TPA: nucleotide pyrophosphohydrolase [Candidatus Limnocylindrales bacterium]|nr:nucleotide pyrophosphohydrolase [Candidatus Limnocylindrales bacterium]